MLFPNESQCELPSSKSRIFVQSKQLTSHFLAALAKRGVSVAKASIFVAQHSEPDLRQAILALDEQINKRVAIHSPDKWMATALNQGYRASAEIQRAAKRPELKIFKAKRRPR